MNPDFFLGRLRKATPLLGHDDSVLEDIITGAHRHSDTHALSVLESNPCTERVGDIGAVVNSLIPISDVRKI
jgi:hypothetical protein